MRVRWASQHHPTVPTRTRTRTRTRTSFAPDSFTATGSTITANLPVAPTPTPTTPTTNATHQRPRQQRHLPTPPTNATHQRHPALPLVAPLEALPAVSCVYLEHNPVASEVDYRERLKTMLPTLTQIDAIALPRR